uniref:FBA_2 domain-containing protein n=2 Tax=Caenorhabditis tropicalis TaxID=1561998 RepID=A0A1I7TH87_9PELO
MTPFHLFQLPILAIENVLSMLDTYGLINISLGSSRIKKIVTTFSRLTPNLPVDLFLTDKPGISVTDQNKVHWSYYLTSYQPAVGYYKYINGSAITHSTYIYSGNPLEEWMKLYDHIKRAIGCYIIHVDFDFDYFPSQNKRIIDWMTTQNDSFDTLNVLSTQEEDSGHVQYLMSKIKACRNLSLCVTDGYQIEIPETVYLTITNSKFIDCEQFLRLRAQEILLIRCSLTNQDFNRFLKSWMAGESHFELKKLKIGTSIEDGTDEIMMGVPHEVTTDIDVAEVMRRGPFRIEMTRGYNITRSDGKVATVCVSNHFDKEIRPEYSRSGCLCMWVH